MDKEQKPQPESDDIPGGEHAPLRHRRRLPPDRDERE
jgi:hypothetical protein